MDLDDLFEGSLEEYLPKAVDWCSKQKVSTVADIAEAGLTEEFASEVLGEGSGASALQRSLLRKRFGTLEAGLEAKRARVLAAIAVSDTGAAPVRAEPPAEETAQGASIDASLARSADRSRNSKASDFRSLKTFTAVCGVSARRGPGGFGGRIVCDKV
eukprot:scaffold9252_cov34-Tisochrysis_lutea.AAC.1